ncbi:hypothetical protein ACOJBO_05320 [Rhizobium beringeri]
MSPPFGSLIFNGAMIWCSIGVAFPVAASSLTPEMINAAPLDVIPAIYTPTPKDIDPTFTASTALISVDPAAVALPFDTNTPSASVARLQVLLDRAGASQGSSTGWMVEICGARLQHSKPCRVSMLMAKSGRR